MSISKKRLIQSVYICFLCILMTLETALCKNADLPGIIAAGGDSHIKWIDFDLTAGAIGDAIKFDIDSYGSENHVSFIILLSLLGAKYGGDFKHYKKADMQKYYDGISSGEAPESLAANQKTYNYYLKAYGAVLGGAVGEYGVKCSAAENGESGAVRESSDINASDGNTSGELYYEKRYGLKLFSPIAAGYYYSHYDDFGASRSYGYRRPHLGHDMMGSVGTPIIAVESGFVEACGWNQYGGWRIGIRSFDGKRYYYYAHLRKGHPYNDMYEGKIVEAGEVIGYLGMTGYSSKEDTNNINTPHLHFGLQIIFDPSQKDGWNQIWLDMYEFSNFLYRNRAEVYYDKEAGEYYSKSAIVDLSAPD